MWFAHYPNFKTRELINALKNSINHDFPVKNTNNITFNRYLLFKLFIRVDSIVIY